MFRSNIKKCIVWELPWNSQQNWFYFIKYVFWAHKNHYLIIIMSKAFLRERFSPSLCHLSKAFESMPHVNAIPLSFPRFHASMKFPYLSLDHLCMVALILPLQWMFVIYGEMLANFVESPSSKKLDTIQIWRKILNLLVWNIRFQRRGL